MCSLWILSYHHFSVKMFEDPNMDLIEKIQRILDYFTKEKIVRIILLLFDNLLSSQACLEIMSDLNTQDLMVKLEQRHWVDEDIKELIDKIWKVLDESYKVFSSIEKLRKEVNKGALRWGPVHTERFW